MPGLVTLELCALFMLVIYVKVAYRAGGVGACVRLGCGGRVAYIADSVVTVVGLFIIARIGVFTCCNALKIFVRAYRVAIRAGVPIGSIREAIAIAS